MIVGDWKHFEVQVNTAVEASPAAFFEAVEPLRAYIWHRYPNDEDKIAGCEPGSAFRLFSVAWDGQVVDAKKRDNNIVGILALSQMLGFKYCKSVME